MVRLREDLFGALDALPGLHPFPGAANFLLVRGPEGLPERLARRGVLVRGCGPFYGLGTEFFRVAVRDEKNGRLVAAIQEELWRSRAHPGRRPQREEPFAERLASSLGGERVLYVATAIDDGDEDLQRRIRLHRERRPPGWGTLEIGVLDEVLNGG